MKDQKLLLGPKLDDKPRSDTLEPTYLLLDCSSDCRCVVVVVLFVVVVVAVVVSCLEWKILLTVFLDIFATN